MSRHLLFTSRYMLCSTSAPTRSCITNFKGDSQAHPDSAADCEQEGKGYWLSLTSLHTQSMIRYAVANVVLMVENRISLVTSVHEHDVPRVPILDSRPSKCRHDHIHAVQASLLHLDMAWDQASTKLQTEMVMCITIQSVLILTNPTSNAWASPAHPLLQSAKHDL